MNYSRLRQYILLGCACTLLSSAAWAGRPLSVDDAGVNELGHGHVETWLARTAGPSRGLIVAPAYTPVEGFEVSGAYARDTTTPTNSMTIMARWRITPAQDTGCNVGASASLTKTQGDTGNTPSVNGMLTCNFSLATVHMNLGATRSPGESRAMTWGVAIEHKFSDMTAHIETFGQQGAKTTLQVGARYDIAKNIQLDGTVGRSDRQTLYSAGMKFGF
jgi:hypothetical protein